MVDEYVGRLEPIERDHDDAFCLVAFQADMDKNLVR